MIDQAKLDELLDQWEAGRERGEELSPSDLCQDCPELIEELTSQIRALKATDWLLESDDETGDFLSLPAQLTKRTFTVPASVSLEQFTDSLVTSAGTRIC